VDQKPRLKLNKKLAINWLKKALTEEERMIEEAEIRDTIMIVMVITKVTTMTETVTTETEETTTTETIEEITKNSMIEVVTKNTKRKTLKVIIEWIGNNPTEVIRNKDKREKRDHQEK
jgi:hypothetical protein